MNPLAHHQVRVGAALVLALVALAVLAPIVAPLADLTTDVTRQLQGPDASHWFGTDENGRDLMTLVAHGARVAVIVGFGTTLVSAVVGTFVGAVSGYVGGRVDEVLMRLVDVVFAFPGILLALLVLFVTADPNLGSVVLALSLSGWAGYARLVRGEMQLERRMPRIEACRALGIPPMRILVRHILPATAGPVLVQATFGVAGAILAEASLSFLGLGPQDVPSWGALLDQGAMYFLLTPHLAIFPGLAIAGTVLAVNLVGDGLRDALDPRTRTTR